MAIKLLNKITPYWYTPESEQSEAKPTRYKMKPLPQLTLFQARDLIRDGKMEESLTLVITNSLIDWENQLDEDGNPVAFDLSEVINLPAEILEELGGNSMNLSELSETERKNLLSQWTSKATKQADSTAQPVDESIAPKEGIQDSRTQ